MAAAKEALAKKAEEAKKAAEDAAKKVAEAKAATQTTLGEKAAKMKEAASAKVAEMKEAAAKKVTAAKEAVATKTEAAKTALSGMLAKAKEKTANVVASAKAVLTAPSAYAKCKGCHGPTGKTKAMGKAAVLAGQDKATLVASLKAYKAGTRNETGMGGLMKGQVAGMSDADMEAIAEYLAGQK